ncbi:MAG: hypothetical protein MR215_07005 [Bacteroidales bacterium]|nr:hypothetical protein [Bacteroidales bacterium]
MADVSERTIESGVADLQSKGILMREGGRKDGRWVVIKKHDEQGFEISLERNKFTFVEKVFSHSIINYNTTMNTKRYTWIPFYKEFAQKLMKFRNDRASLLKLIYENREEFIAGHLHDVKGYGNLLKDIDPFTVFGLFNRQLTNVNKINSIRLFKELFNMESDVPSDFAGVPVLNNMNSLFFGFKGKRGKNDIENIWILFEKVLNGEDFEEDFNAVSTALSFETLIDRA